MLKDASLPTCFAFPAREQEKNYSTRDGELRHLLFWWQISQHEPSNMSLKARKNTRHEALNLHIHTVDTATAIKVLDSRVPTSLGH